MSDGGHDEDPGGPSRGVVIGLIVVVVLVVGGFFLSQQIRSGSRVQDCVMAGRTNCAPVQQ